MAVLTYHHPPRNFLTFHGLAELGNRLGDLAEDDSVRVVVLESAVPSFFAAHADLDELAGLAVGAPPEARAWCDTFRRIEDIPQPVVVAIDGQAWGGAVELSLSATFRIASERAHFRLPEIGLGFLPGAGVTRRLSRLLGARAAAGVVLSGRVIDAEEALRLGLVQRVLPTATFAADVLDLAEQMAVFPRAELAAGKEAIIQGEQLPVSDGLKLEGRLFAELLRQTESRALDAAVRHADEIASGRTHVAFGDLRVQVSR
ncbi:enoyl-CoA hydratase/isomerase family protein [Nocardia sp. CDC160]|uniref:enoyl-CoA hydratase/isomerase family protein n=1 Tax=Nocardia sp. CDC160 TaxID=3112166 RepID=UPI002DBEA2DD|nr:enoyl-CoA hydratase/isomerase family protein [Nocardia sp. CDC160]MEC3920256.1 enoyl-CoA hydratase/isomerase family protein [Nocardia sp. CDC160]